jgi:hypothetical protein
MIARTEMLGCAAASSEARAQDADRAALAGTGLEGLFDTSPTGNGKPPQQQACPARHLTGHLHDTRKCSTNLKEYRTSSFRNLWFPVQALMVGQAPQLQIRLEVPLGLLA